LVVCGARGAATGRASASHSSASHPAIIIGKDSRKAGAVLAPNQNIENNPMQSSLVSLAWMLYPRKHLTRRANQGQYSTIAQFVKRPWPCPATGSSARLQAKNPYPQLKLHRLARGE
jgi:hypothetical protein